MKLRATILFYLLISIASVTNTTRVNVGTSCTYVASASAHAQGITRFGLKHHTGPSSLSAPTFTNGHAYQSGYDMYIYEPRGYVQAAAGSLPLMIFYPGYGARDNWSTVLNVGEGLGYYLNSGAWDDLTYNHIVVVAQYKTADVDPNTTMFDNILSYLTTNGYKYDPDRVSVTGLSGGAIGCYAFIQGRTSDIASVISVAGPSFTAGWSGYSGLGVRFDQGTNDGVFGATIGGSLYWANGGFGSWQDQTPAPRGQYYYPEGHSTAVWNTHVYNPATAEYNFFQFASKFNKDATAQATQFVDNAEATENLVDYKEAKTQTDQLSSGAPKTALLARLATLLTTINSGGSRYWISPQTTSIGSLGSGYNIWTAFATGNGITNIVDINNVASTIDITMTQECATGTRDGNASGNNANTMRSHGFDNYLYNVAGLIVDDAVNNGRITISGITTGKLMDIYIYTHHIAANDNNFSTNNILQTICNSVTQTQYVAYNNYQYIAYLNVPETSNSIDIDFDALGTRDALVTGIELVEHN